MKKQQRKRWYNTSGERGAGLLTMRKKMPQTSLSLANKTQLILTGTPMPQGLAPRRPGTALPVHPIPSRQVYKRKGGEKVLTTRKVAKMLRVPYFRLYHLLTDLETTGKVEIKRRNRSIIWNDELLEIVEKEALRRGWIEEPILSSVKEKTGQV